MALVSLAAAPVIGLLFDSRTAGLVAASMAGTVLLQSLTNVPEAWLQREFSVRRRLVVGPAISLYVRLRVRVPRVRRFRGVEHGPG